MLVAISNATVRVVGIEFVNGLPSRFMTGLLS